MRRVSFWIFVLSFISPFFMYLAVEVWLAFLLGEEHCCPTNRVEKRA